MAAAEAAKAAVRSTANFNWTFITLLALVIVLSLAACGGDEPSIKLPEVTEPGDTTAPEETTVPVETEPAVTLTVHENTFFSVGFNEEDGWIVKEDDIYAYDGGGSVDVRILDEDGNTDIVVSIGAEEKSPESFRKNLYIYGVDMMAYAKGEAETVDVGGQPMLYVDQSNGDRFFFGRIRSSRFERTVRACRRLCRSGCSLGRSKRLERT
jgi:predicted small lipoprotein YifL